MRVWRDADGAVLSLAESSEPVKDFDKVGEKKVRRWCREIAEDRNAGLIEAHKLEAGGKFIYKRFRSGLSPAVSGELIRLE